MTNDVEAVDGVDVNRLRRWLAATVDPSITDVVATRLGGGNSSGAWRLNLSTATGYCLMHERFTRILTDRPATGIPSAEETWDRWEAASGRSIRQRDYWTAYGATIMCVTETRAMLKWGMPVETIDTDNIVVAEWEAIVKRVAD